MKKLTVNSESREVNFDLYNRFTNFQCTLFGNNAYNPDITRYPNITYSPLPYRNPLVIDPLQFQKPNNLSWKTLDGLESVLQGSSLIGITDTYYFWNYQALRYAKKNHIPIYTVIWCNIPNHISSWLPPYSWITKQVIQNTSLFILRNNYAYQFTDSLKIPRNKTTVVYPGINLTKFNPKKNKTTDKINILFVGSLTIAKGVKLLLEAFHAISKTNKNVELHIIGSGPLQKDVLEAAKSLPIRYYGFTEYAKLPQIYSIADIFCAPSQSQDLFGIPIWHEYFSYTLLEAQASGLPIVTTDSGGISEEVDPQNSLIEKNNLKQLINALQVLINDPEKRNHLSTINRLRAETYFDISKQSQLLEQELIKL